MHRSELQESELSGNTATHSTDNTETFLYNHTDSSRTLETTNAYFEVTNIDTENISSIQEMDDQEIFQMLEEVSQEESKGFLERSDSMGSERKARRHNPVIFSHDMNNSIYSDNKLFYFEPNSNTLVVVDLESLTYFKKVLEITQMPGNQAAICNLPLDKLFHCGGNNFNNFCFLLDKKTLEVKELPGYPLEIRETSAVYFNNCIYVFGGSVPTKKEGITLGVPTSKSFKFDLNKKEWIEVSPLPEPSAMTSCIIVGNLIYVTGNSLPSLYVYNPFTNSYQDTLSLENYQEKVLVYHPKKAYLIVQAMGVFGLNRETQTWEIERNNCLLEVFPFTQPVHYSNKIFILGGLQGVRLQSLQYPDLNFKEELKVN
mmetsp:Transcript_15002/g.21813  ORF Transcript_15002/g.21813 Transcript_15002/m.21813 type:complete len:372 (+) Transcript_15002:27-1142(+)